MEYGICNLSVIPVRLENNHESEQTNQLLFGEYFKIIEYDNFWCKIENDFDNSTGWVDKKQFLSISDVEYDNLKASTPILAYDILDFIFDNNNNMLPITIGSILPLFSSKKLTIGNITYNYEGETVSYIKHNKSKLIDIAFIYLNSPFQWGGKSPLGIDCSGFTQMVYKLNGVQIPRTAADQATKGEVLSFIEESEPGDLAFFDNEEGVIIHVGIILENNYIIHSFGKVRIDRIDHSGIYNIDTQRHSHKLRVIKKIC